MLISLDLYCFMYLFVYVQYMCNYRYIHRSINFDSIPYYFFPVKTIQPLISKKPIFQIKDYIKIEHILKAVQII